MFFHVRGHVYSMREGIELTHAVRTINVPVSGLPEGRMEEFVLGVKSLAPQNYPINVNVTFTVTLFDGDGKPISTP